MRAVFKHCCMLLAVASMWSMYGREDVADAGPIEPPRIGNLALSQSQQPAALFAFGQTIVQKGDKLLYGQVNQLKGCNLRFTEFAPTFIYGINDSCSLTVSTPVGLALYQNGAFSQGFEDLFALVEYAFASKPTAKAWNTATVVVGVQLASGSDVITPATGFGSECFFTGFTYSYLATDWYAYVAEAILATTAHDGTECGKLTKYGNQFLYQFGLGRNLRSSDNMIFTGILECNGILIGRSKINNEIDCLSASHRLFLAPTLWFSTQQLTLQAGIGFPVYQDFHPPLDRVSYILSVLVGWKFG